MSVAMQGADIEGKKQGSGQRLQAPGPALTRNILFYLHTAHWMLEIASAASD